MTNTHITIGGHKVSAGKVYSTSEVKTGDVWIDGKPIYRKVVDCGVAPSSAVSGQQLVAFSGIDHIHMVSNWHSSDGSTAVLVVPSDASYSVGLAVNPSGVYIWTGRDRSSWGHIWVIVEYTKTTD